MDLIAAFVEFPHKEQTLSEKYLNLYMLLINWLQNIPELHWICRRFLYPWRFIDVVQHCNMQGSALQDKPVSAPIRQSYFIE